MKNVKVNSQNEKFIRRFRGKRAQVKITKEFQGGSAKRWGGWDVQEPLTMSWTSLWGEWKMLKFWVACEKIWFARQEDPMTAGKMNQRKREKAFFLTTNILFYFLPIFSILFFHNAIQFCIFHVLHHENCLQYKILLKNMILYFIFNGYVFKFH